MFFKYIKKQHIDWLKNKNRSNRANSVWVDKKRKTLFLREKKWKFEFTKTDIKNFFNKSAYRISMFVIFVMSVAIISFSSTSTASVAQFYANSCLGGWENPGNAEGAPQVFDGSEEVFGTSTSAILRNSMSEIFCGDFQSEISDATIIKRAVLKLSWSIEEEFDPAGKKAAESETGGLIESEFTQYEEDLLSDSVSSTSATGSSDVVSPADEAETAETLEEEGVDDGSTTIIESDDFTSSLQDILDAPSDAPVEFTLTPEEGGDDDTTTIESDDFTSSAQGILDAPSDVPVEFTLTPEEGEDDEVETETESAPDEEPDVELEIPAEPVEESGSDDVSFFKKVFKTVFAAEDDGTEEPEPEEQPVSSDSDTTTIESDDFTSSLQDILDAPSDAPVEFTLTPEEGGDDDTTTIESDDFTSSAQGILDAPSDVPVEFTLTPEEGEDDEVETETENAPDEEPDVEEITDEEDGDVSTVELSDIATGTAATNTTSLETTDDSGDLMSTAEDVEIHSVESDTTTPDAEKVPDGDAILSEVVARPNDFLEIEYTFNGVDWQHLGFVGFDNWKDAEFELPVVEWDELEKLQVRIKNLPAIDEQPVVYLDSMWIEVSHSKEKILDPAKLENLSRKKSFSFNDELKFEFEFEEKETAGLDAMLDAVIGLFSGRKFNVSKVQLINARGEQEEIESFIEYRGKNMVSIIIKPKNRSVRPGKYILETYVETDGGETVVKQQEFYLGVLAINVNKSIYLPEERAYLQMAALTDTGHTICNATLWMSITDPGGTETDFSTEDGTIQLSGECHGNNVTDVPDYFAYYNVNDVGTYAMKLVNLDTGHEIKDSFEVRNEVAFEVERVGPTRIYPPATYQVTIYVTASQDFSGDIVEYVPDSFAITNTSLMINNGSTTVSLPENIIVGKSEQEEKTTEIVWSADIKKGDICTLGYEFDAPDISPEFYLLGPLEFYE